MIWGRVTETIQNTLYLIQNDLVLLVNEEETVNVTDWLEMRRSYRTEINVYKLKVIRSGREELLWIITQNQEVENTDQFKYFGSLVTKDTYVSRKVDHILP